MKKIALIIPMLQPYRITFYEKLINSTKEKYEWCVYHGIKKFDDARPAFDGKVNFKLNPYVSSIKMIGPLSACFQANLYDDVVAFNPDIILVNANTGELGSRKVASWAKKKNKKIIMWVCSWDSGKARGGFRWVKKQMMRIYYKKGDMFIAYSTHALNMLKNLSIPASQIRIAYNGLDLTILKDIESYTLKVASSLKKELSKNERKKVFLYVGGLIPMKSPLLLIEAFLRLFETNKDIELWIIGDGPLREEIKNEIIASSNNCIKYFGRITDGVDKYFKAADWFVLPGAGGLAMNQAMFWETPCICSFADGSEEDLVLDEITGYRFVKDDVDSLCKTMQKALNTSKEKYKIMGEFSKYLVSYRSNTDKMHDVFLEALNMVSVD